MNLYLEQLKITSQHILRIKQYGVLILEYQSTLYKAHIYKPTQEGVPDYICTTDIYTKEQEVVDVAINIIKDLAIFGYEVGVLRNERS